MHAKVPVADLGEEPFPPPLPPSPHLFLDQTKARRAEKIILGAAAPPPPPSNLRVWMTVPPSYLEVWIRHWFLLLGTE